MGVDCDTKVVAHVYRREGRITHNKRGGRIKMRMKFRRNIHEDTLFNIRFHTIEHKPLLSRLGPRGKK
jgi:hypothetical protein